eukprot:538866-Pleurochrysis_carterae.AAC.2
MLDLTKAVRGFGVRDVGYRAGWSLPSPAYAPHVSIIAAARASCCTLGSATTRSAVGTPEFTASTPP